MKESLAHGVVTNIKEELQRLCVAWATLCVWSSVLSTHHTPHTSDLLEAVSSGADNTVSVTNEKMFQLVL